jgi:hypothetical protein
VRMVLALSPCQGNQCSMIWSTVVPCQARDRA